MADSTEEEHLDNPAGVQSENAPENIVAIPVEPTIHPNQETETMEVHKHPHQVTHKKNGVSIYSNFSCYSWQYF